MEVCSPRVLYLPNEGRLGDQVGPRAYFERALESKALSAYTSYSFLYEAGMKGVESALLEIESLVEAFRPDIIFWQHIGSFPVDRIFLKKLKAAPSKPTLVYHEGDMYGEWAKRPTSSMIHLAQEADIAFVVGLGSFSESLRKAGCSNVLYAPHSVDTVRFGRVWEPTKTRQFDVVMIANRVRPRLGLPFLALPGTQNRELLARRLAERLGDRFGLFGSGWKGFPCSRGTVPFAEQERVLQDSWIGAVWNYFDETPYYFSDRLPITLMSGVAHVTNYHPGYDALFRNGKHLHYAHTVDELIESIDYLLSRPRHELIELGLRGQRLAKQKYTTDVVMDGMMEKINDYRQQTNVTTKSIASIGGIKE